jgi:hypothetical protein
MYLINIDESGKPILKDLENYILSAFIVNEEHWFCINNDLNDLKKKIFTTISENPLNVEIHIKDIVHGNRRFKGIPSQDRFSMLDDIYTLIENMQATLISVAIMKNKVRKKSFDVEMWAFKLLFERICMFLTEANQHLQKANLPKQYGLLLLDAINTAYDLKVRKKYMRFFREGTEHVQNEFLLEDVLFVESHFRNLTQLADATAFCIRRNLRPSNTYKDQKFAEYFNKIENLFNKDSNGNYKGSGLKIFP